MELSSNQKVNQFLEDVAFISTDQFELVMSLRALFFEAKHDLVEDVKYGGLAFKVDQALVGGIYTYKNHLSVEFSQGFSFTDDKGVLEGAGKQRRHLKLMKQADIQEKDVAYFVQQACSS
jgi:hypothetical protein